MKKIYNDIIPFKGFLAMCLWPFIFVRNAAAYLFDAVAERHENIHGEQQKEMLAVGIVISAVLAIFGCGWWSLLALPLFFWWYGAEWLVKLCCYRNGNTAYKNLGFEREAYTNQNDASYLESRKRFAWIRYI